MIKYPAKVVCHEMRIARLLITIAALLATACGGATASGGKYLTCDQFRQFAALCPEIKDARLAGLAPAGYELWSKNQLKMPAEGHLFEGDFCKDGKSDSALVIADGAQNYVVIAQKAQTGFKRIGFVRIHSDSIRSWNGTVLCLDDSHYIAWNGKGFRMESGPLAIYGNKYGPTEFANVMMKFTYVGAQEEPYPGFLFTSFHRFPDIAEFKTHRTKGVSYGNDDGHILWHLSLSDADLRDLVILLNKSDLVGAAEDRKGTEAVVSHSLSLLDVGSAHRPNFYEVFLSRDEVKKLFGAFAQKIEKHDENGAKVLREYATLF